MLLLAMLACVIITAVNISDCVKTDDISDSSNNSYVNNDITQISGAVVGV